MNILSRSPWSPGRLVWNGATLPFRALWLGYGLLWWAFDDERPAGSADPRRAAIPNGDAPPGAPPAGSVRTAGQGRAFEVVDSRPEPARGRPRPIGALRAGFAATLALSGVLGAFSLALVAAGLLPGLSGGLLWLLTSGASATGTILLVRRRERRLEMERLRRAQTPLGRARARASQVASETLNRAAECHRALRAGLTAGIKGGVTAATPAICRLREGAAKVWSRRPTPTPRTSA